MYKCFIKYAQQEIKEALEIMADSNNYPILIHCSLGKDRTGVIIALLSEILEIPRDNICCEYAKSRENLAIVEKEIKEGLKQYYLEDWLLQSPSQIMKEFLEYIDKQYNSVSQFLEAIGVSVTTQQRIRDNLLNHQRYVQPTNESLSLQ